MTGIGGFILQIFSVLAVPILIFAGFFAFWYRTGRKSKRAWVRNMSVLTMGASLGVPLFMVLFLLGMSSGMNCPNGNCNNQESYQAGQCRALVEDALKGSVTKVQEVSKLPPITNDVEKWRVVVRMRPMGNETPIPPGASLTRDEYMKDVQFLYKQCSYAVECIIGKNSKGEVISHLTAIKLTKGSASALKVAGNDYCNTAINIKK